MDSKLEAKLNMFRATITYCNNNAAIVATLPAFATTLASLNSIINAIIATAQQEDLATRGITIDKIEAKKELCRLAADIAAPIFAFASATANHTLKQQVKTTFTKLIRTKDDTLAPRCQNIISVATENLAGLAPYGLTAEKLTALQATITGYQQKVPAPRNSIAQKKTTRQNLKTLVKKAETVLKEQMDKTVVVFRTTHPGFVATYKANRSIIDAKQTTTTLKGEITDAKDGSPVSDATIVIVETGAQKTTGEKGTYEIKPIPAGMYTIEISAPKYKSRTVKEIMAKQGQITHWNIALHPL